MNLGKLYAITDPILTPTEEIMIKVELALRGGVDIIQLRDKLSPMYEQIKVGSQLAELCHAYNALFIVNDYPEVAYQCGADGVHIGSEDGTYEAARDLLGAKAIIGVSCYKDINKALIMEQMGADYVAFGAVFPSPTKPKASIGGIELGKELKVQLKVPFYAIGGITLENVKAVLDAGYYGLAVITAIFGTENPLVAARQFRNIIDGNKTNEQ